MERLIHTGDTPNGVEFRVYRGRRKTHFYARFFVEGFEFDSMASVGSSIGDATVNAYTRATGYSEDHIMQAIIDEVESRRISRDKAAAAFADAEAALNEIHTIFERRRVAR